MIEQVRIATPNDVDLVTRLEEVYRILSRERDTAGTIIYVNESAAGDNHGTSWVNAFTTLQSALEAAEPGDEIWVAGGTYSPDSGQPFSMIEGVRMYGGFAGNESNLNERNLAAGHVSSLQGNESRVISNNKLTNLSILDGFTITGGTHDGGAGISNANSSPIITKCNISSNSTGTVSTAAGGGMYNDISSSPVLNECLFIGNMVPEGIGGGLYNYGPSTLLVKCTFLDNSSSDGGAGMSNANGSKLINCVFSGNNGGLCGGIRNDYNINLVNCLFSGNLSISGSCIINNGSAQIVNCTLSGNKGQRGAIRTAGYDNTIISNSIIWGNNGGINGQLDDVSVSYSLVQDWSGDGIGNMPGTVSPQFLSSPSFSDAPFTGGDYRLRATSPCINRGSNGVLPIDDITDLAGNPRIYGGTVDMGAYEWMIIITQPTDAIVSVGSNAVFTITTANGINPNYQWQYSTDSRTWINIANATSQSLNLMDLTLNDNGKLYHVLVISDVGNTISNAAILIVD